MNSHEVALTVYQEAVFKLAQWAGVSSPWPGGECEAVTKAKSLLAWDGKCTFTPLKLVFDRVRLSDDGERSLHYLEPMVLGGSDTEIPYPVREKPSLEGFKKQVNQELEQHIKSIRSNWQNLSLLSLLVEKFGTYISFSTEDSYDVAFVDSIRSIAAVAGSLPSNPPAKKLTLIAGDLSGIQNFIYTIASEGALKSLRARSFYLSLVAEEIAQRLLESLELPREWDEAIKELNILKNQKFIDQINKALGIKSAYSQKCGVCYRDDVKLEKIKPLDEDKPDSILAYCVCRKMYKLGGNLREFEGFIRSARGEESENMIVFKFAAGEGNERNIFYQPLETEEKFIGILSDTICIVNNWNIENYLDTTLTCIPINLGNYARESEDELIARVGELAGQSKGIKRVSYVRMDVDNLGKIFSQGLRDKYSLPRLTGLSRQLSYFFTIYLNTLAQSREKNLPEGCIKAKSLTEEGKEDRLNLVFIYAGGDNLFVVGAWNEVVAFSFDIYQAFRTYTGHNPDITISGGIYLANIKFPLYQAAELAGEAEGQANYFRSIATWIELLNRQESDIDSNDHTY